MSTALTSSRPVETMFSDALQFAIDFDQPIVGDLYDLTMLQHRQNLLAEEVQEYIDAEFANDLVEVADAAVDILYIALGTLVALGKRPELPRVKHNENADMGFGIDPLARIDSLARGGQLLRMARDGRGWQDPAVQTESAARNGLEFAFQIAADYNLPIFALWDEVHGSNMAKKVDGVVIRHPETGKVQKPEGWVKPDIASVLLDHGWVPA